MKHALISQEDIMLDMLSESTARQLVAVIASVVFFCFVSRAAYNLYFHPLARFPGPKIAAISDVWWALRWTGGRWPFDLEAAHNRYGLIVRIAPNELSFASLESFRDIYGHTSQDHKRFLKAPEYYGSPPKYTPSIVTYIDPEEHRAARRTLAHAFSAKALREQTELVRKYLDLWITHLQSRMDIAEGVDIGEWYNWLTFDIIGDLAFGESFDCVAKAAGSVWVDTLADSTATGAFVQATWRFPLLGPALPLLLPKGFISRHKEYMRLSSEKMQRRMARVTNRDDFFSKMLISNRINHSEAFMIVQAQSLIIAGSETTQTTLTAITHFLLRNLRCYERFRDEVRDAFDCVDEINGDSTARLPYLSGVIDESLRLFPPVAFGLARKSPGSMVDGQYIPAGTVVSTNNFMTSRSTKYFLEPLAYHPERWLPPGHVYWEERFLMDRKEATRPFSMGSRVCLGMNLAYMEIRLILARLVHEFDWELVSESTDWEEATVRIVWRKPTVTVRFKRRDGNSNGTVRVS